MKVYGAYSHNQLFEVFSKISEISEIEKKCIQVTEQTRVI
jgi:hypothetical protein